jgi:hypothetical protein
VNDFETKLKELLNQHVDERAGARPPAPAFDPAAKTARPARWRSPRPWIVPLVAAAAVVVVAAGTVGATQLMGDRDNSPATTGPTAVTPSSTASSTRSAAPVQPSKAAPTPVTKRSTATPRPKTLGGTVVLGDTTMWLPKGWVARHLQSYAPQDGSFVYPGWCLSPAAVPVVVEKCPIMFWVVPTPPSGQPLDVDVESGTASNPEYCTQGTRVSSQAEQTGDRKFGGRPADWRRWTIACNGGPSYDIEQYVVASAPAFILYSSQPDSRYHQAITEIAAHSTLPAQRRPLRLMDRGIIRSLVKTSTGYRIALDRVIETYNRTVNENPKTYDYPVSGAVLTAARRDGRIAVGSTVYLTTDGNTVTTMQPH